MVLSALTGWLDRRARDAIAYLIEENQLLRNQLGTKRLRFTDDDRRRLAVGVIAVDKNSLAIRGSASNPEAFQPQNGALPCNSPTQSLIVSNGL